MLKQIHDSNICDYNFYAVSLFPLPYGTQKKGRNKNWQEKQTLYWRGKPIKRDSDEYQDLLNRAYNAMYENTKFKAALEASKGATLTHSMGKNKKSETVLTTQEFCSRLTYLRDVGKLPVQKKLDLENENKKGST